MTRRRPRLLLAAVAALAAGLSAAPAPAQPSAPPDLAVLNRAGAGFPEKLGRFVRVDISSVEPGRVSAHYLLPAPGAGSPTLDIFVGPAAGTPAEELARTQEMIRAIFEGLEPVRDLAAPPGAPGAAGRVWKGRVEGSGIVTAMMISRRGPWRIKIRATVAAEGSAEGLAEIERAIREYRWWIGPVA